MSLFKNIVLLLVILVVGGIGGVLFQKVVLPRLTYLSPFNKIIWLKQIKEGTTIINKTEKIEISENTVIEDSIDKLKPAIVGVVTKKISGRTEQIITEGTGFVLAADGLIVTANDLVPVSQYKYYIIKDGKIIAAEIIKRDQVNNLALLKIQESNLPVVSLGDSKNVRLGQAVILIGTGFVNLSSIRSLAHGVIFLNLRQEQGIFNGGLLTNVNGDILGLLLIDSQSALSVVSVEKIKLLLQQ